MGNPESDRWTATEECNPYRVQTFKWYLYRWAMSRRNFSKEEFLAAHAEMKAERFAHHRASGPAWWNEFMKAKTFVIDDRPVEPKVADGRLAPRR